MILRHEPGTLCTCTVSAIPLSHTPRLSLHLFFFLLTGGADHSWSNLGVSQGEKATTEVPELPGQDVYACPEVMIWVDRTWVIRGHDSDDPLSLWSREAKNPKRLILVWEEEATKSSSEMRKQVRSRM